MIFCQIFTLCKKNIVRIRKIQKDFVRKFDFKNIKCPVKIRDIHKIKKMISALVFLVMKIENILNVHFNKYFQKTY